MKCLICSYQGSGTANLCPKGSGEFSMLDTRDQVPVASPRSLSLCDDPGNWFFVV